MRVEARRLRSSLKKYYETEGRRDALRIDFPKGHYIPVFVKPESTAPIRSQIGPKAAKRTLAVLPFENMTPQGEQEYFCDGITEELINALTHVEGLRVAARTSTFAMKGRHEDVRRIGEGLNVSTIVEGTVRKAGDRPRITAQLVNVADGYHLWSNRYDRQMKDVFAIQDKIARGVVRALRIRLVGQHGRTLVRSYTDNLEAYHLYLKGRYHWHKQTVEDVKKGCKFFEQAIEKEPNYAPAFAGVADGYNLLAVWGHVPPRESWPQSKAAFQRALQIDDGLAEAHTSACAFKALCEWDWSAAEREYRLSLQLNPDYPVTRQAYAMSCLAATGRTAEAVQQMEQVLELHPKYPLLQLCLGWTYEQQAMIPTAIEAFEKARVLGGPSPMTLSSLGHGYALSGDSRKARVLLARLAKPSATQYVSPFELALIHTGLGERNRALNCLEQACQERSARLIWIKVDPRFHSLRTEPRFIDILRKMRLAP